MIRSSHWTVSRRNEQFDEFANVVSHDLRNPLGIAQGYLELLEPSDDELLAKVRTAHDRMEQIIGDVLTLARQGRAVGDTGPVKLSAVVETAWHNVETGDAELLYDGDEEGPNGSKPTRADSVNSSRTSFATRSNTATRRFSFASAPSKTGPAFTSSTTVPESLKRNASERSTTATRRATTERGSASRSSGRSPRLTAGRSWLPKERTGGARFEIRV